MEVIIFGLYDELNKKKLEENLLNSCNVEIVWDYSKYNIESLKGIKLLEKTYDLQATGILLEKNWDDSFTSYPLIYEITEFILQGDKYPRLFKLIDGIQGVGIKKMIMAFADYWDEKTLVRIQEVDFGAIKENLNNIYTWCETYVDLDTNEEIRDDEHPLILEIDCT